MASRSSHSDPLGIAAEDHDGFSAKKQVVDVAGRRLTLTNLDKVMFPSAGTTKADVIEYYATVADRLLPHTAERPATRKRWVNGVGTAEDPGQVFFQKNLDESTPSWVRRRTIEHSKRDVEYPLVGDLPTLIWLAQTATLEIHVPQWRFGPRGARRNPDRLVLDLDPGEGVGLPECAEVARHARAILRDMGLDPVPVTSGSKGIHLYAGLDGKHGSDDVSAVAHELARALEADHPDLAVSDMKKSLRRGKVLVDWSQNNGAKTTVAPYSLRGRLRPTVAAPRTWKELASADLAQLEYTEVLTRLRRKDPLAALAETKGELDQPTRDRLDLYRSKRDGSKTPEPVPESSPAARRDAEGGNSFVIQRHDARNLHFDFRLEHDGVLVSWALPKGVPIDPGKNHLAVQTEDHPLEYGSFEGVIPKGEYGAGEVEIWDAGTYELEKWREGEEVIATLHGTPDGGLGGPRRYALIHTGGDGKAEANWLIHLMKPARGSRAATSMARAARSSDDETLDPAQLPSTTGAPRSRKPMLVQPTDPDRFAAEAAESPEDWAFEMKWDGIRAIAAVDLDARAVTLTSRNGNDLGRSYPEIAIALLEALADGPRSAVIDGEIVALDAKGRPSFSRLQTRMGLTRAKDVEQAARKVPVRYLAFDLLDAGDESLLGLDYDGRRDALEAAVASGDVVQVPPAIDGDLENAMATSLELGLEGVVAKERGSKYRPGVRAAAWRKVKHQRHEEVTVIGWRPGNGRRAGGIGSLLLAVPGDDGALRYAGRVGTGFSDRELDGMARRFASRSRKTAPVADVPPSDAADAHWITPNLLGEVSYAEWTPDGRLRHASWRGWRTDK